MKGWIARRTLVALGTAAGISLLAFVALQFRAEEAVERMGQTLDGRPSPELQAELRARFGLDRPLTERVARWAAGAARGNLGDSWSQRQPVTRVIAAHLPLTLALTGSGLLLQLLLGIGIAAWTVRRRGTWKDAAMSSATLALAALPEFCVGLLLLWPLAIKAGWFPISGAASAPWRGVSLLERLHHLALPALCLGLCGAAVVSRLVRVRWEEELASRQATAARTRGLSARSVAWRHGLRAAAGPLCAAVGLSLPNLVGGAVVVEQVFDWPGLGSVLIEAVALRDIPLLAGINVVLAALVAGGGLAADLTWMALDPRVRAR